MKSFSDGRLEVNDAQPFWEGQLTGEKVLADQEFTLGCHRHFPVMVDTLDGLLREHRLWGDRRGAHRRVDWEVKKYRDCLLKIDTMETHEEVNTISIFASSEISPLPDRIFEDDGE